MKPLLPIFAVTLAGLLLWGSAGASGEDRLKAYLSGLRTLSSEFRQITLSADGGRVMESRGTFYLKRPGRFRWEYDSPTEQTIVADGERIWLHDVELDQISHQGQAGALGGTPAQLLASEDPIEEHFRVSPWEAGDERQWVELEPKGGEGQVARIRIGFVGERLDTLLMEDSFGQITRFSFDKTRRNPTLDEALFRLDLPVGGEFLEIR